MSFDLILFDMIIRMGSLSQCRLIYRVAIRKRKLPFNIDTHTKTDEFDEFDKNLKERCMVFSHKIKYMTI